MSNQEQASYEVGSNSISTVQDQQARDGLNPNKSLPVQLTINVSLGVLIILLFGTAYYYGFFL